ncbi:MAG: general secretion pathway protein GspB [Gammaproteobacteria bacterium]|nr:general secretion pathway protein GspB [Gammaproteobacteria bacterium]
MKIKYYFWTIGLIYFAFAFAFAANANANANGRVGTVTSSINVDNAKSTIQPILSSTKTITTLALADPTRPDFAQPTQSQKRESVKNQQKKQKTNPVTKLKLQQTLVSKNRNFAIINGKTLSIGKKINGAKLIKINSDNVVLSYDGKKYTLNLTVPSEIKEIKR